MVDYYTLLDKSHYGAEYYESIKDDYPMLFVKEISYDGNKFTEIHYEDEKKYRELAKHYALIMTGGSDFHGEERKPGVRLGGWGTCYGVVEMIRNLAYSYHV